jgi:hypothetical protein
LAHELLGRCSSRSAVRMHEAFRAAPGWPLDGQRGGRGGVEPRPTSANGGTGSSRPTDSRHAPASADQHPCLPEVVVDQLLHQSRLPGPGLPTEDEQVPRVVESREPVEHRPHLLVPLEETHVRACYGGSCEWVACPVLGSPADDDQLQFIADSIVPTYVRRLPRT